MKLDGELGHLTYCSNIHPGESWSDVSENLRVHLPKVREALDVDASRPFGIGLRLSAAAAASLAEPRALQQFRDFLGDNNYYVFTLNGFPYGPFHGTRVKEEVYLPDWKDPERLRYTNQLADIFAGFPEIESDVRGETHGTISTVPGAFKSNVRGVDDQHIICNNLIDHVGHLFALEQKTGRRISLVLEPEPCCFLETIEESVAFFSDYLYSERAVNRLARAAGVSATEAHQVVRRHLGLCLDLCHAAVEFEDPDSCIDQLRKAEISIGKIQISSGLRLCDVDRERARLLDPFDDAVYLHQVVERCGETLTRFTDLDEAMASLDEPRANPREWRVHFHVPIFLDELGEFSSTRSFIEQILQRHRHDPVSTQLEVETYTWSVLPEAYRNESMDEAIARELGWVINQVTP